MFIVFLGFMFGMSYSFVGEVAVSQFIEAVFGLMKVAAPYVLISTVALVVIGGLSLIQFKTFRAFVDLLASGFRKYILGLREG
jgi:hypothetical protein